MISIIIPVYNCEKYIERCLNSIESQSYPDYEVVIVNDGSTDNTKEIIEKHRKSDKKIISLYQDNKGVSAARNTGLKNAHGNLIVFIDSDDYIEPNYLKRLSHGLENHNAEMVCCGYYRNKGNDLCDTKQLYINERCIDQLECMNFVAKTEKYGGFLWNKIYAKTIIDKYDIHFDPNIKMCEDMLFTLEYITHINNTFYIPDPLYHYVNNDESATKKINIEALKTLKLANKKIKIIAEKYRGTDFYYSIMEKYADDLLAVTMEESLVYKKDYIKRNDGELKTLLQYMSRKNQRKYKMYKLMPFELWNFGMRIYRKIK